jgi:hypothetical protein
VSNLLLRDLRDAGVLADLVLPFADLVAAASFAQRTDRVVMLLHAANVGRFWVVTQDDARRLEADGWMRYVGYDVSKPPVH